MSADGAETETVHALSFDVEHWHSATLLADHVDDPVDHIRDSVDIVLDLLDDHDTRATFFIVGELAESYPDVVEAIADAGHEIGSHGHTHTPVFDLTPGAFADELSASAAAIESVTGSHPVGFRAPNFSVTQETDWAIPVLADSEYEYDSSVFPVRTPMYGVGDAPRRPYVATSADPFGRSGTLADGGIPEVPLAAVGERVRLPMAGGFYARVLPARVLSAAVGRLDRRDVPAVLYFHPWEFNPAVKVPDPPAHKRFVSFHGIEHTVAKLDRLLDRFEWGPIESLVPE